MYRIFLVLCLSVSFAACGASDQTRDARPRAASVAGPGGFAPQPSDERVRTVQVYRTGAESSLPIVALGSGQTLTVQFDMIDGGLGGPVSIYFYHADRFWNRRLMAVEYLRGFNSDTVREYRPSAASRVRYTNYSYAFPNNTIEFTRSGNFIMRVTELGDERAVLFERVFFLTEEIAETDLQIQSGLGTGLGGPLMQPVAQVRPPARFASPVYDFDVCFARDARFDLIRCSGTPDLVGASLFQFYLPRERAFQPTGPRYVLDLSILGAGPQIAGVDFAADPYEIELVPDDARFATAFFDDDLLTGQTIIRGAVRDAPRPATEAEYVNVTFRYVTRDRERVAGRVVLTGSFNGWTIDPAYQMEWDPVQGSYKGTFLLKQGKYSYTYFVEDPAEQERRLRDVDASRPSLYTALVYLNEPAYNTDRLVSVQSVLGQ